MKKPMIALGLVMVIFFGISYVYAQEQADPPGHEWMHGKKAWGHGMRLNLTPEQKAKFQELHRKFIGENAQLMGALMAKRLELKSLWTDPKVDPQAILAKERELRDLQNRIRDKIIQYRLEARSSLTPEQIERLGRMKGMGLGFGRGFHHHHGQGMAHSKCGCRNVHLEYKQPQK
ncbi:MAG TPA: periplasmic heavy metal sensor [Thermodesulfobacteriota bacterium]|nr:periplasmic heavy metal sensor [Thermodesulfobacteriota bacterium]